MSLKSLRVNGQRLWTNLMEMAQYGATSKGGSSRLALSPVDSDGRRKFLDDCKKLGLSSKSDAIGNLFVRYDGSNNDLDPVVMGSHLDTQPLGGKFDGVYGVLSGLEVLRTLHENQIRTKRPIEVAVWTNEEGSRFPPAMMGSAVYAGVATLEDTRKIVDSKGVSVGEALDQEGWAGDSPFGRKFHSYFESHIEQGPVLEQQETDIGVVTGGQGLCWLDVKCTGKASHAGSTPMALRTDTLFGVSEMALEFEKLAEKYMPDIKLTIGEFVIDSPSRNVIAGEITFSVDLRHPHDEVVDTAEAEIYQTIDGIAAKRGIKVEITKLAKNKTTWFHDDCVAKVQQAADELGYSNLRLISGAGHDAIHMASSHCPTTMIFIPCKDGISHNEAESIKPEEGEKGCNVLLQAVLVSANE